MSNNTKVFLTIFFLFLILVLAYPSIKTGIHNYKQNDTTLVPIDTNKILLNTQEEILMVTNFIDDYYHDADSLLKTMNTIDKEDFNNFNILINKFNNKVDSVSNSLNIKINRDSIYNKYKKSIDSIFNTKLTNKKIEIKNYHIIIGSFKIEKNANRLISNYENGNKNLLIIKKNNLYHVSIMSFSTLEEAKKNVMWLKNNTQNKNCWIMKI